MIRIVWTILLLTLMGCDLVYEDNLRWLAKGQITDARETAIPGIQLKLVAENGSDRDLIGSGYSDHNGWISIRSISPSNATELHLSINTDGNQNLDSAQYSGIEIALPLNDDYLSDIANNDYTIDFGKLEINRLIEFQLLINRQTDGLDTLAWSLKYKPSTITLNGQLPFIAYAQAQGEMLPDQSFISERFTIQRFDTLEFSYTLINNSRVTELIQIITDEETRSYEFNF